MKEVFYEREGKMTKWDVASSFENIIMVENFNKCLSNEERKEIEDLLHSNNIDIIFYETGPKASFFDAITIFFNEPITKMIINGLLSSAAYDAVKFSVISLLGKLNRIIRIRLNSNIEIIRNEELNLRFKAGNAEMNVLISNKLTHEQNLEYMEKAFVAMIEIAKTQIPQEQTYEAYIIESDSEKPELIKVKTIVQYAKEKREKAK
jgi:hypothetical protein